MSIHFDANPNRANLDASLFLPVVAQQSYLCKFQEMVISLISLVVFKILSTLYLYDEPKGLQPARNPIPLSIEKGDFILIASNKKASKQNKQGINGLPNELKVNIFRFLNKEEQKNALVCMDFAGGVFETLSMELREVDHKLNSIAVKSYQQMMARILYIQASLNNEVQDSSECFLPFRNLFKECGRTIVCLELTYLSVTDEDIRVINSQFPNLKKLDLARCVKITDEALAILAKGFKSLKYLNLFGCSRLSTEGFKNFRELRPDVKHHLSARDPQKIDADFENEINTFHSFDQQAGSGVASNGSLVLNQHLQGPLTARAILCNLENADLIL